MPKEGVLVPYLFNGKTVRVFLHERELWFVLGDVGKALGISNIRELARKILTADELIHVSKHYDEDCRAWKATVRNPDSMKKNCPNLAVVNESGLYTLIMRSTKPEAVKFRRWVTHEVLPTIRKTGRYELVQREDSVPEKKAVDFCKYELEPVPEDQKVYVRIGRHMSLYVPMSESGYRLIKELCEICGHN